MLLILIMDRPLYDEQTLCCFLCNQNFKKTHEFKVHLKSSTHSAAMERRNEKQDLLHQKQEKERRKEEFKNKWFGKIQPLYQAYEDSSMSTVGSLVKPVEFVEKKNLENSIYEYYEKTRPRELFKARRKALYKFVYKVCKVLWPECELDVYGSIPHKLDGENSDIDMSIKFPSVEDHILLDVTAKAIECVDPRYITITRVLHARIPLISIQDSLIQCQLDLSIWNVDKLHISEIFTRYFEMDKRIRPLVYCVRQWSKKHQINDAYSGYINSFGWTVAMVCFLMVKGIVPVVDVDSPPEIEKEFKSSDADNPIGDCLFDLILFF